MDLLYWINCVLRVLYQYSIWLLTLRAWIKFPLGECNYFLFSLWQPDKAQIWVPHLDTPKLSETWKAWGNVITLDTLCLAFATCGIQREGKEKKCKIVLLHYNYITFFYNYVFLYNWIFTAYHRTAEAGCIAMVFGQEV